MIVQMICTNLFKFFGEPFVRSIFAITSFAGNIAEKSTGSIEFFVGNFFFFVGFSIVFYCFFELFLQIVKFCGSCVVIRVPWRLSEDIRGSCSYSRSRYRLNGIEFSLGKVRLA